MYLLAPDKHYKALELLKAADTNTLFAEVVARNEVCGQIFADDPDDPEIFYIRHPYYMTFLCGRQDNSEFNRRLLDYMQNTTGNRTRVEWLQVYPRPWDILIREGLGHSFSVENPKSPYDPVIYEAPDQRRLTLQWERLNFRFDADLYNKLKANYTDCPFEIRPTDRGAFEDMKGAVTPKNFWNDADHFLKDGIGFTVFDKDNPLSTAFCSYRNEKYLELGIETVASARGGGLAIQACAPLLDYCIKNGYRPLWSCHSGNIGSIKLAERLGFVLDAITPYYRIGF